MKNALALIAVALGVIAGIVAFIGGIDLIGHWSALEPTPRALKSALCMATALAGVAMIAVGMRGLRTASGKLAAAGAVLAANTWESVTQADLRYERHYQPPTRGKHSRPSVLTVRVASARDLDLQFNRETWFDRFCKHLGIAKEFETGNASFDRAIYVRGDVDSRLGMALKQASVRSVITAMLDTGFNEIRHETRRLEARWTGYDPAKHGDVDGSTAASLAALVAALPPGIGRQAGPRTQWSARVFLWAATVGFAACGLFSLEYPPLRWGQLWLAVLPVALMLWLGFAWFSAWLLHGHSRSHDHWIGIATASLLALPLGTLGGLGWYNGKMGAKDSIEHQALIVDKQATTRKGRTTYTVYVRDWRRPDDTLSFRVESGAYAQASVGQSKVLIVTHDGRIGIEWLQGYRLVPLAEAEPGG